jgi:hypothetical protein
MLLIKSGSVANLLGTNLVYINNDSDVVTWRINIDAIKKNYPNIVNFENGGGEYNGLIKILIGEKSHNFPIDVYRNIFPDIYQEDIVIVNGAGKTFIT